MINLFSDYRKLTMLSSTAGYKSLTLSSMILDSLVAKDCSVVCKPKTCSSHMTVYGSGMELAYSNPRYADLQFR
jgi:hypothetical protein